jgi:hypothetical protein
VFQVIPDPFVLKMKEIDGEPSLAGLLPARVHEPFVDDPEVNNAAISESKLNDFLISISVTPVCK